MRLAHALIVKSIIETLFVASLAIGFYFAAFPPSFQGWGEVQPHTISGWAVNQLAPYERVEVQLFIDGAFVARAEANLSRRDVVLAGWARDEWHGYAFPIPALPPGSHEARVYAVHASDNASRLSLQLVGDPLPFTVDDSGSSAKLSK